MITHFDFIRKITVAGRPISITTVVIQWPGTLNDLGQWAIFKSARKSMTWDMGHSAGREPGPLLRAKRGFKKNEGQEMFLQKSQHWTNAHWVGIRIDLLSYRSAQTRLFVSMLFAISIVRLRRLQPELNCGSIFQPAACEFFGVVQGSRVQICEKSMTWDTQWLGTNPEFSELLNDLGRPKWMPDYCNIKRGS